jgi:dihydropteroate synthase
MFPNEIKNGEKVLTFEKPRVMGILNVTPDSFSDGGKYDHLDSAVKRFDEMVEDGVDIIDIGGESTGPGSHDISLEEELERVIPIVKKLRKRNSKIWLSIDTYKAEVARQAIEAGVDMVNDVLALRGDKGMCDLIATSGIPVVLMYSKDNSGRTTGESRQYMDVVEYIGDFFKDKMQYAQKCGIKSEQIILDPGMGAFVSSDSKYSLQILKRLREFQELGHPILIGPSRKSFIGQTLGLPLHERREGSFASAAVAMMNGAAIVRVHDTKETCRVRDMLHAIEQS